MRRKRLLLGLLIAAVGIGGATVLVIDRDKRLTFRVVKQCCAEKQYVRYLLDSYETGKERVKQRVVSLIGETERERVVEFARDDEPRLRRLAVRVLVQTGPDAMSKLVSLLKADLLDASDTTAVILVEYGPEAAPVLEASTSHPDRQVQWWSIRLLGKLRPVNEKRLEMFDRIALNNQDPAIRIAAIDALGEVGPAAAKYVPSMVLRLEHADPEVRAAAARALGMIGADAEKALADLIVALNDDDVTVRANAWDAILQIQSSPAPSS